MDREIIRGILISLWKNGYMAGQGKSQQPREEAVDIVMDFITPRQG